VAKIPPPRLVQTQDRQLNEIQSAIALPLRQVLEFEELKGAAAVGLTLSTTPTKVQHGLGRRPIGWRFTDKTSAGDVYRTAWDERTITLVTAAGTVAGDIWIW
jgi:hypothetical protein